MATHTTNSVSWIINTLHWNKFVRINLRFGERYSFHTVWEILWLHMVFYSHIIHGKRSPRIYSVQLGRGLVSGKVPQLHGPGHPPKRPSYQSCHCRLGVWQGANCHSSIRSLPPKSLKIVVMQMFPGMPSSNVYRFYWRKSFCCSCSIINYHLLHTTFITAKFKKNVVQIQE